MTWPTGPPPMPPSGWYEDPELAWTWRYFDGAHWTDHRSPMWVPPARDPRSLSTWFERSVVAGKLAVRRVGVLLVGVWLVLGALGWWLALASFDDERGRELRRLLDIDQNSFGSSTTTELTDAEAERVWELLVDIFWSALPGLVALAVAVVVAAAWTVAMVARVVDRPGAGGDPSDHPPEHPSTEGLGASALGGLRRVPAVIGSGVVVFGIFAVVWGSASLPVLIAVGVDGGGVAIVSTVVFVALLVAVVTFWLWGRLTLASVIAARGGHGLGVAHGWALTHGRFWFVVGRLVITALVAGAVSSLVNVVVGVGPLLGFAVYLALLIALQAVGVAISILVTVCGHVATIDQVEEPPQRR